MPNNRTTGDPDRQASVEHVRSFWEANPLFVGESRFTPGTREFFDEHWRVTVDDCFAGTLDPRIFPRADRSECVLDLGCGPGNWAVAIKQRGAGRVVAADLTEAGLALTRQRAEVFGVEIETSRQNAEALTFPQNSFSHVNCNGVIHHTPDTAACVREIARVLRPGGTALISVYYRNAVLANWSWLRHPVGVIAKMGAGMKGRGRERMLLLKSPDEIVRLYDGEANPIGKSYSRREFEQLLSPHLAVDETFLHFFPARALPIPLPRIIHRWLDRRLGFMIYARCHKSAEPRA